MSGHKSLIGMCIVITGAASGIGKMTAMRLARAGARLFLIDVSPQLADVADVCDKIADGNGYGERTSHAHCDVTDRIAIRRTIDLAAADMGRIDIVFVNAGIAKPVALAGDISVADKVMAVNFSGAQNTIDACLPYIEEVEGYILVNASMGAIVLLALMATAYGASKAAIAVVAQGVNLHFKGMGARCAVLYMAEHDTPMEKEFEDEAVKVLFEDNPWLARAHRKRNPRRAVDAIIRAMEKRPLFVHAPFYTVFARWFPAVPNWMVRNVLVRNPQRALDVLRNRSVAT